MPSDALLEYVGLIVVMPAIGESRRVFVQPRSYVVPKGRSPVSARFAVRDLRLGRLDRRRRRGLRVGDAEVGLEDRVEHASRRLDPEVGLLEGVRRDVEVQDVLQRELDRLLESQLDLVARRQGNRLAGLRRDGHRHRRRRRTRDPRKGRGRGPPRPPAGRRAGSWPGFCSELTKTSSNRWGMIGDGHRLTVRQPAGKVSARTGFFTFRAGRGRPPSGRGSPDPGAGAGPPGSTRRAPTGSAGGTDTREAARRATGAPRARAAERRRHRDAAAAARPGGAPCRDGAARRRAPPSAPPRRCARGT